MTSTLDSTDKDHADFDADLDAAMTSMLDDAGSISMCGTQEACDKAIADAEAEDSPYTYTISCGATKLVASFAALALASM